MNKCDVDLLSLATAGVAGLMPYQPGKPLDELEREYGVSNAVKLASNENPIGPSPLALQAAKDCLPELARYPDGNGFTLKRALADRHGLALDRITLGNGSNDILELITRATVTPQHDIIFSEHAFAVYPIVTQAVGAQAVVTPAKNWGYDLKAILDAITDKTRIIFIANPNNPTGTWLPGEALEAFLREVPEHILVVLDEAYAEYVTEPGYVSAVKWLDHFDNLVVTRTFSKAYGLAGLRVGYSLSHAHIADLLNRVRQPFNVNSMALAAATAALADQAHLQQSVQLNWQGLEQLTDYFQSAGLPFIPSVGNFICVDVGRPAGEIYEALLRQGVIVRPVANYGMPTHLRVTVGTAEENRRFIQALTAVLTEL